MISNTPSTEPGRAETQLRRNNRAKTLIAVGVIVEFFSSVVTAAGLEPVGIGLGATAAVVVIIGYILLK